MGACPALVIAAMRSPQWKGRYAVNGAFSWPVCSTADTSGVERPQVAGEFMQSRHGGQRCLGENVTMSAVLTMILAWPGHQETRC